MSLTFRKLREINIARSKDVYPPFDHFDDWVYAVERESKEVLNTCKKLKRYEDSRSGTKWLSRQDLLGMLGDEIANTVIYLDLLAARASIDLDAAVRCKFNETSIELKCDHRL